VAEKAKAGMAHCPWV